MASAPYCVSCAVASSITCLGRFVPFPFNRGRRFDCPTHDQFVVIPIDVAVRSRRKGSRQYGAGLAIERDSEEGVLPELIAGDAGTIVFLEDDLASILSKPDLLGLRQGRRRNGSCISEETRWGVRFRE